MKRVLPWTLASILLLTCGTEPEGTWEGKALETANGRVVQNPEEPLGTFSLEQVWSRGSEEWADPSGLRVSGEQLSFIDRTTTTIHLLRTSDGSPSASFGRRGEGPGELGRIYSAAILKDRVYVSHSGSLDLTAFSLVGEFQGSVPWGTPVGQLDRWTGNGLVGIPLAASGRFVGKSLEANGDAEALGPDFQSPFPAEEFGSCLRGKAKAGWKIRVLCSALRIRVEGPGDTVPLWIEHPSPPTLSTEGELDEYVARYWAMQPGDRPLTSAIQRQLDGLRDGARIRPTYSMIRIDPDRGWIVVVEQPFGDQSWVPAVLHLFLLNGVYLATNETDLHIRDLDLSAGSLFVLTRNPGTDELQLQGFTIQIDPQLEEMGRSLL